MFKRLWVIKNEEDGAAIIFGLLLSLVGFALTYVMMLSAIQTIEVASVSVTTNRLQSAAETGINDALSLINSGYDFTGNTIENPFKGKDRITQEDNTETANIRWEWWVEPIDLTNRDECAKTGTSNTFSCGYYIYSKASMPVLDENAEVITRGILIPTPIKSATQTQTGDITYSSRGGSNFRHGVFGLDYVNMGSNVKLYSFQSTEDSTVRKPSLVPDANGLMQPGADSLPSSVNKSSKTASVASNQSIVLNNTSNANQQVSTFNLYRSGVTVNSLTPHASCMIGSDSCDTLKINEQDYSYDLSEHSSWIDTICPSYSPAANFSATSQIPMGLTCLEGDVTLDKNYIAGTSQLPSIFVVKGNVTFAAGADLNPYASTQAFQLYVKDGNITNIAAENGKIKFAGTMLATSTLPDKGEINLAATPNGDSITIYGALAANKVNLGGDITIWQDVNTKYIKNGEDSYYQLFSLKVVSSTRSATDTGGISGTTLKPVVNLAATAGSDGTTLDLTWNNPASNKGVPLTDYSIEISGADGKWTSVANTPNPTYTVTGLLKYTVYNIRVKANNIYGSSQWTVIPALTQGTLPTAPQGIQLTSITNKTAILNWQAPVDDGGKPITGYRIEYSQNADLSGANTINTDTSTTKTIDSLIRNTKYYFRVSAITSQGIGPVSISVDGTTLKTVPAPPVIGSVSQTNTTANLSWSQPTDDGGSTILGYNVYRGNVQINTTLVSPTAFTYQMTGLTPETSYQIYVTALNALGESAKQDPATVQTVQTNPDAPLPPTGLTLTDSTTTAVTLSWTAGGGGTASQYVITLNGNILTTVTSTSYTITGLTPGTNYTFGVIAKNITSQSSATTITHVSTPLAPSTAPTVDKTAYIVSSPMVVAIPSQTCQAPTTPVYKVYRNNTFSGTSSSTPITVTNSTIAETSYITYTVVCSYAGTTSVESEQSPAVSALVKTAPSQPSNVRVTEIYGLLISLSWDAVAGAVDYTVTLSTGQTVTTTGNTAQITGTARNIAYNNSTTQPATEAYPTVSVVAKDVYGYSSTPGTISVPISRMRVFPANDYMSSPSSLYTHFDTNALVSSNGDRAFVMQTDRNIVTYNLINSSAIWAVSNIINMFPIDRWTLNAAKNFIGYRNGTDGTIFSGNNIQVLAIGGGGGGGGGWQGGGGGAGGFVETVVNNITPGAYAVIVGGGGAGASGTVGPGNGANSSVFSVTALGGGKGATEQNAISGPSAVASTGGSGGGGSHGSSPLTGALGTVGQGNAGGTGHSTSGNYVGAGGGGAGSAGQNSYQAYYWTGTANASASYSTSGNRTNLIANPSLEVGATTGWTANAATASVISTAQSFSGTTSLLMTSNGAASLGPWWQRTAVTAGTTYTFSGYAKDINTSVQYRARIEWYNASGALISTTVGNGVTINTTGWTRISVTDAAPVGATQATPTIYSVGGNPVATKQVYFDGFLLEASPNADTYFDGSTASSLNKGGNGGAPKSSSISGTETLYAGGGGGSRRSGLASEQGLGGGAGAGNATGNGTGINATANTGSGGGAGGSTAGSAAGGAGGSGIVIVKYLGAPHATGGTITQIDGYTIHTFTSSGTLTFIDGPTMPYCPGGCNGDVDMMVMENAGYATNYQWMSTYWRTDYIFQ